MELQLFLEAFAPLPPQQQQQLAAELKIDVAKATPAGAVGRIMRIFVELVKKAIIHLSWQVLCSWQEQRSTRPGRVRGGR